MIKQSTKELIAMPSFVLPVGLGVLSFVFTYYSLELSLVGTVLAPLWFPTSIMMVALFRHSFRQWPMVIVVCALGSLCASAVVFPINEINLGYCAINIIEALLGASLLRRLLPQHNPLQNLNSWVRLVVGSAVIPRWLEGCWRFGWKA